MNLEVQFQISVKKYEDLKDLGSNVQSDKNLYYVFQII